VFVSAWSTLSNTDKQNYIFQRYLQILKSTANAIEDYLNNRAALLGKTSLIRGGGVKQIIVIPFSMLVTPLLSFSYRVRSCVHNTVTPKSMALNSAILQKVVGVD
jgi:hypothetical protein